MAYLISFSKFPKNRSRPGVAPLQKSSFYQRNAVCQCEEQERDSLEMALVQPRTAIASISTRPPLGRAATWTVERAGYGACKWEA